MEREPDDFSDKQPAPEGYEVPPEPDEPPQLNEQPDDPEVR